jgi:hypothetical protein
MDYVVAVVAGTLHLVSPSLLLVARHLSALVNLFCLSTTIDGFSYSTRGLLHNLLSRLALAVHERNRNGSDDEQPQLSVVVVVGPARQGSDSRKSSYGLLSSSVAAAAAIAAAANAAPRGRSRRTAVAIAVDVVTGRPSPGRPHP